MKWQKNLMKIIPLFNFYNFYSKIKEVIVTKINACEPGYDKKSILTLGGVVKKNH